MFARIVCRWGVGLLFSAAGLAQQVRVTELAPEVYLFNYGFHSNIFLVTPEGVVATDPIHPKAAERCLSEIRKLTDQPVRYVIYSHDHVDHIAGGGVYKPDATFIAHRRTREIIRERKQPEVVVPDIVFETEYELELAGRRVRLLYLGPTEAETNILIYLPDKKVLMWVDNVRSYGVPFRYLEEYDLRNFRKALARVEELEFEHLVHGHGPATGKEQVSLFRRYLDALEEHTRAEMQAYPQNSHLKLVGNSNPHRFFDTYIATVAGRVVAQMAPAFSGLGGFQEWGIKNAERMVVFLLHELPFDY